jgi:hypothetical protein
MGTATEFRSYAQHCVELAQGAPPSQRSILLQMADMWLRLARQDQVAAVVIADAASPDADADQAEPKRRATG